MSHFFPSWTNKTLAEKSWDFIIEIGLKGESIELIHDNDSLIHIKRNPIEPSWALRLQTSSCRPDFCGAMHFQTLLIGPKCLVLAVGRPASTAQLPDKTMYFGPYKMYASQFRPEGPFVLILLCGFFKCLHCFPETVFFST